MCFKFIPHVVLLVVAVAGNAVLTSADERVWPTGTPTWIPRKTEATPVPVPATPLELEATKLGEKFAAIDQGIWQIVKQNLDNEEQCLELVDARLHSSISMALKGLRGSEAMLCEADKKGGQKLSLTTEEARRAFVTAYQPAVVELRSVRELVADNPAAEKIVDAVRSRQNAWQNTVCEELAQRKSVKSNPSAMRSRPASSGNDS